VSIRQEINIAFDVRPGNGGPPRYVASLVRALIAPEWSVQFVQKTPRDDRASTAVIKKVPPRLSRIVPSVARNWLGFRREANRLASAIRERSVDLFHTQSTGCEEMPVAARRARVPYVLGTFHVDSTYDLNRERSGFAHRAMEWYSNRSLHQAIAVSEATKKDWVRRTGIPAERVVTIHNGIDPEHFVRQQAKHDARARLGLPRDAVILGGLGRLAPAKGFAQLIEALAALRSDFPNALVAIAGDGPLREQLETRAQSLGVAERVVFLGFQTDVNLVLDACDVFVLSSLCEALPFALLEAMAHELPVVGTTVGGVPEVIIPGENGFLAPPRDGGALAASVRPLLESTDLRNRMGGAGRQRVIKHFHEADMVQKTLNVYRQMSGTMKR
jgi:glycosyltransferase involved in cell wall biosynthesis